MKKIGETTALATARLHEAGAGLVELAISLPLFLMLMFGALDLGNLLLLKQEVGTIAYEGARVGSEMNGLELDVCTDVTVNQSATRCVTHAVLQDRIRQLRNEHTTSVGESLRISTERTNGESGSRVAVTISSRYQCKYWLCSFNVSSSASGPYLLLDS